MPGITTAFAQGLAANRPAAAAANAGFMYFSTDSGILAQSTGSAWTTIGPAVALDALTSKGDLLTRTSSAYARLGVGSNGQVLTADSTQTLGVKWAAAGAASVTTKGDLQGYDTAANRVPVGADGQVLTADSTQALGLKWAAGTSSATVKLSEVIVGVGGAATIAFSSIAGTYRDLLVVVSARTDQASVTTGLQVQLNADTAANYDDTVTFSNTGTTIGGISHSAATSMQVGYTTGASATAGDASGPTIRVHDYARTAWRKVVQAEGVIAAGDGSIYWSSAGAKWRSTAAVASILLFPASGNFVQNSVASLYGVG